MSGFKALNIESDDESDIEVDDTKELQIEDALKLYQTALKYHAAGPDSFELAAEAYEQLFQSDIFKYPESQTELKRIELYGATTETEDFWQEDLPVDAVVAAGGLDTGPSTLPQILHLSHKNYAQFKLEYLTARLAMLNVSLNQILNDATAALDHFVEALDKDDTDLDLWRRTASVGDTLESKRVARFCLEAVLDGDDEGLGSVLSLPGLDEGLAGEQLRELIGQLDDQLSIVQSPLPRGKRRVLSKMLKQRLGAYQGITDHKKALQRQEGPRLNREAKRVVLKKPKTWAEVGELLLTQLMTEQHGTSSRDPAIAFSFDLGPFLDTFEAPSPRSLTESKQAANEEAAVPNSFDEQFPGHDGGKPTVQPQIASANNNMETGHASAETDAPMIDSPTVTLPTRKRSGDAAGLNDGIEEGRTKSKRTRTHDSRQAIIDANTRWEYEQQLNEFQAADDWMFETVGNLFERIGVVGFEASREVRQELQSPGPNEAPTSNGTNEAVSGLKLARNDLQSFLTNYSEQRAHVLLVGGDTLDIGKGSTPAGPNGSLSNGGTTRLASNPSLLPDDGLFSFLSLVNREWLLNQEVAWKWICWLLSPPSTTENSIYCEYLWPEDLKTMVVRTLVNFDDTLFEEAEYDLERWKQDNDIMEVDSGLSCSDLIQTVFELHLDIYCLIKEPNSGVDAHTVSTQRDRLQRWSALARETMQLRSRLTETPSLDDNLNIRFLWATTFHIATGSDISQDHVIECMNDLRALLVSVDEPWIQLQNNAIMPELSVAALDREISRLTTKDFFLKVTSQDQRDPVAIIESLEPLLDCLDDTTRSQTESDADGVERSSLTAQVPLELVRFLQSSDISLRMMLWQRLRDAYLGIDYKPMVVSCYSRMVKVLLTELKSTTSVSMPEHDRQVFVLRTLRLIQDMITKAVAIVQKSDQAFECIDEDGLRAAVSTLGEVLQLVQVFNVRGDSVRVGQSQSPTTPNGLPIQSFTAVTKLIEDAQVHIWVLLYTLLKEAIFQFHELFPNPAEDMFDFLRAVHRNLGLRGICGKSNKMFVRMLKDEFLQMKHIESYDSEQAQVLYDLYGFNCFLNPSYELIEHRCPHDAFIEKSTALQAVDLLIHQAAKLPMKDLAKHPIKDTIEKVHGSAPRKKPTEAILRNREVYRAFLRSPINPLDLFNCLKGEGNQLTVTQVPKEDALLASKGWYFLMGHIALAKFRLQKRTGPTPTEDVDIAIAFFMQDLEYSMNNWETWFRLAQAYDTKIEESVVWSAEKLNNSMTEIVQLQRAAIHCYTMATALAYRAASVSDDTTEKMTELFTEFAMRLYASSREPFSMQPFALDDTEKFLSPVHVPGVSKGKPFKPLPVYTAWKLAKVLFQRALWNKSQSWTMYFNLGKCMWKMHAASDHYRGRGRHNSPPAPQEVLACFIRAIEVIPDEKKKDSREKREPVLEPHYKLVSIVHKMVMRNELSLDEAKAALDNSHYTRSITFPQEMDEWVPYVLAVLKILRAADKSNWHHRMVARAAQIIYDDADPRAHGAGPSQDLGAIGAKHELTQQMFTKTMVLQVWRPECERAGRHFVYTARYTRFFVRITEQLKDRANLEMLARRVRRRPHDVFEHSLVWQDICNAYLRLLRNHAALPEGLETSTFSNIFHDQFLERKEPLERWMQVQETGVSPALDVLREVQELKKINQSLMKPGPIDDLIGDAYAHLFSTIGKKLWDEEVRIKAEEEAQRPPPVQSPPRHPTMSLTHLMNIDGTDDSATSTAQIPQTAQAAPPQADQSSTRRKIGVGRREIRSCAEACVQKTNASSTGSVKTPAIFPRVQVVIDSSKETDVGDASVDTSAPGSIHDSADESELSDLEEEGEDDDEGGAPDRDGAPPRLMFPGLASNLISRDASEGFETANEEQGEENGDVEMGYSPVNADEELPETAGGA
ncbi:Histone transcription regulator 3 [Vermiconidia calcicola]|uniref:Histone transcription regulator 3 n=1 Tax=Vermiconidia calcicola TaxID=1690605 RepID=A0ACC3NWJ5_9PEZI|nr:Histone transcription regulator 3 [Vermiconidia calcicola]